MLTLPLILQAQHILDVILEVFLKLMRCSFEGENNSSCNVLVVVLVQDYVVTMLFWYFFYTTPYKC